MEERSTKRGPLCLLSVIYCRYLLCLFVFQRFPLFIMSVAGYKGCADWSMQLFTKFPTSFPGYSDFQLSLIEFISKKLLPLATSNFKIQILLNKIVDKILTCH